MKKNMRSLIIVTSVFSCVCFANGGTQPQTKDDKAITTPEAPSCEPTKEATESCPSLDVRNHDKVCYTPEGKPGVCVGIRCCPQLGDLFRPPMSSWNETYVINSKCEGAVERSVCCGPLPDFTKKLSASEKKKQCKQSSAFPPDPWSGCCGRTDVFNDRISGGTEAKIYEYPWLVLLEYSRVSGKGLFLGCGGALISGKYVLTAAHCVAGSILKEEKPEIVRLGEHNTATNPDVVPSGGGVDMNDEIVRIPIEEIVAHQNYNPDDPKQRDDIALIRLKETTNYTSFIKPICLPKTDIRVAALYFKENLFIAGWGGVSQTQPYSNVKMYTEVSYRLLSDCQYYYSAGTCREIELSGFKHICADGRHGQDAYQGDSGGPLMSESSFPGIGNVMEAVGLAIFGAKNCSRERVPEVYTHVFAYTAWIRSNIRP